MERYTFRFSTKLNPGASLIQYEKLLGVTIDYKLSCNIHVGNLCKNANWKLLALARVTPYIRSSKKKNKKIKIKKQKNKKHAFKRVF